MRAIRILASLVIALSAIVPTVSAAPIAEARGIEFLTRYVKVGTPVALDGSGSYGADCDLSYSWTMISRPAGSGASIEAPSTVRPTFIPDRAGDYVLDLVVADSSGTSDPDRVTVTAIEWGSFPPLPAKNADRWMQLTPGVMDRTLPEITLPGTHDSGAYWLDKSRRGPDFVVWWEPGEWLITDEFENDVAYDLAHSQNQPLLQQLNGGIRYFDLRVTRRNGIFHTYHGLLGRPLTELLQDIRTFMERSDRELLVIDASHMANGTSSGSKQAFTPEDHHDLMQLLVDELGTWLYPRNEQSTVDLLATPLRQILASGPRILLIYSDDYFFKDGELQAGASAPHSEWFWTGDAYTGSYTDTVKMFDSLPCPRDLISQGERGQYSDQLCNARRFALGDSDKGFTLHQTLTANTQTGEFASLCKASQEWWWLPWLTKLGWSLACDQPRSLLDLSRTVNPYLPSMLEAIGPVQPALIKVDFYEESAVVSKAIALNQVDLSPPRTAASVVPPSNEHGCNTTKVTAKLVARDEKGGSGVKEVHYWTSGAAAPNTVVSCGSLVEIPIEAKGVTTVHYYGVDRAGNAESSKALKVNIAPGGDITGDCTVNRDDLTALMRSIVRRSVPDSADADEDGKFTARDFKIILCASGATCEP